MFVDLLLLRMRAKSACDAGSIKCAVYVELLELFETRKVNPICDNGVINM